jgi:hypothetical protein
MPSPALIIGGERLRCLTIPADRFLPLEPFATGTAFPELPLHLLNRLLEPDDEDEDGEQQAQNPPEDEVAAAVRGQHTADYAEDDRHEKYEQCRFCYSFHKAPPDPRRGDRISSA